MAESEMETSMAVCRLKINIYKKCFVIIYCNKNIFFRVYSRHKRSGKFTGLSHSTLMMSHSHLENGRRWSGDNTSKNKQTIFRITFGRGRSQGICRICDLQVLQDT